MLQALSIPSTLSLNVLGIKDEGFNTNHLEAKVKLYQDDHYCNITPLIKPHHLQINSDNYLWKDSALVVVENNDLRRGVLHHQPPWNCQNHSTHPAFLLVALHERLCNQLC